MRQESLCRIAFPFLLSVTVKIRIHIPFHDYLVWKLLLLLFCLYTPPSLWEWLCFICVGSSSILVKSGDGGHMDVHTHSAAGSPETWLPHPDLEPSLSSQHGLHLQIFSALGFAPLFMQRAEWLQSLC